MGPLDNNNYYDGQGPKRAQIGIRRCTYAECRGRCEAVVLLVNERVEVERAHFLVQEPVRPIEVNLDDEGHEGEVPGRAAEPP